MGATAHLIGIKKIYISHTSSYVLIVNMDLIINLIKLTGVNY